jgi:hypothetical protein
MNLILAVLEYLEAYHYGAKDAPVLCVGHDGSYRLDQLKRMTIEGRVAGIVAYSAPSASRFLAA